MITWSMKKQAQENQSTDPFEFPWSLVLQTMHLQSCNRLYPPTIASTITKTLETNQQTPLDAYTKKEYTSNKDWSLKFCFPEIRDKPKSLYVFICGLLLHRVYDLFPLRIHPHKKSCRECSEEAAKPKSGLWHQNLLLHGSTTESWR